MTAPIHAPDFVILGAQYPDRGVVLVASKDLKRSELRAETDERDEFNPATFLREWRPGETRFYLTTEMKKYVVVTGEDYPSAFTRLFTIWSPTPDAPAALASVAALALEGQRSIE
ncbi:hypothetical protein [Nocardia carnea]|uniref:hypothetical protein n=1 Tax=Nocardia carnea TaxID=37328 RepID=UPI002457B7F4|nr:hypothetical protein [Nocardia carnea]